MSKIFRYVVFIISIVGIFSLCIGGLASVYFYNRLTRDLPKIEKLSDYKPKAVTQFFSNDGVLIAEIWDERRYPVLLEEMPAHVKNAFLAAEDASFYEHSGIDFFGILRAVWVNMTSRKTKQGASTITQQIVKELLLSRERTYERKIKEALLSYRLENSLSKNEILNIYLNQIFLGSGAYGVKAAAKTHFRKELVDLTIAEAAFLGALPKKPSELTRPENRSMALGRTRYVLKQMRAKDFITEDEYSVALSQELKIYPSNEDTLYHAPYFASHSIKEAEAVFQEKFPELSLRDPGGYKIYTTLDLRADQIAEKALKTGLKEVDKREGWKGPIGNVAEVQKKPLKWTEVESVDELSEGVVYRALVSEVDKRRNRVQVKLGKVEGSVDFSSARWARTMASYPQGSFEIDKKAINPINEVKSGDIIEVSLTLIKKENEADKFELILDQTPEAQSAMAIMNVQTGEVKTIQGGFDYQNSKFNRATQAYLQPGSSFKPFIYLSAIDILGLTPSSLVPDAPISFPTATGVWSPQNYDEKFLGPITLRTALQKSRNVVSVYLLNRVGIDKVINMAKRFGISTPIARNMSLALGTSEVHMLDMVKAYAGIASAGYVPDQLIIKKILTRDDTELLVNSSRSENVVDPRSAFVLEHMMRGVVDRGTAQTVKALGRPVAGKTGTTNEHMDTWFIGFTPDLVAAVWVGFDTKRSLGKTETGGRAAAPIFLEFMKDYLGDGPVLDFVPPEGVTPVAVDVVSGVPVNPATPGAFIEYFKTDNLSQGQDVLDLGGIPQESQRSREGADYLTNSDF